MPRRKDIEKLIFPLILIIWLPAMALLTFMIIRSLSDARLVFIYSILDVVLSFAAGVSMAYVEKKYMAFSAFRAELRRIFKSKEIEPGRGSAKRKKDFLGLKAIIERLAFQADRPVNIVELAGNASYKIIISISLLMVAVVLLALQRYQLYHYGYSPITTLHVAIVLVAALAMAPLELLSLKLYASARASRLERELPFISVFLTMTASLGLPLTSALSMLKESRLFKGFRREVFFLEKISMFYGLNMLDSMDKAASLHPSKIVREFYQAMTTIERSGGDRFSVLRERSKTYFALLRDRVNTLIEKFSLITNLEVLIYVLIPLGLLVVSMIFAGRYGLSMVIMSSFVIPITFTILILLVVKGMIIEEVFDKPPTEPAMATLVAGFLAGVVFYAIWTRRPDLVARINAPLYIIVAALLIAVSLPAAVYYWKWYKESDEFIYAIPLIARHIAEEAKKGFTPKQAMMSLTQYKFGSYTRRVLNTIIGRLMMGYTIEAASRGIRMPWLAKAYFELLSFGEKLGVDPRSLDELAGFMNDVITIRKILDSRSVGFKASALIAVFSLVFGFMVVRMTVFEQIVNFANFLSQTNVNIPGMPINPISQELKPLVVNLTMIGIMINTYLMGIVAGHVTKGHPAAGFLTAIIFLGLALLMLYLSPLLIARMGFM